MAMAAGWAYYYRIRPQADDMKDKLGLYLQYKEFWKKHTMPGERRLNVNDFCCVPDIRHTSDHMDTLRLYHGYKHYWDKHRIPGETVRNEVLWEDPWWKRKQMMRLQTRGATRSLPPLHSRKQKRTGLSSAASANSTSTILTSKSLPAKIAAQQHNGTKQNGTQTELLALPNISKKGGKEVSLQKTVSLPAVDAKPDNDNESTKSSDESKLPPVVARENTT